MHKEVLQGVKEKIIERIQEKSQHINENIGAYAETLSYEQIASHSIAAMLGLIILPFTLLNMYVIGREYAEGFKPFMRNYPTLNHIFLFYLALNDVFSLIVRPVFCVLIYVQLFLSVSFLIRFLFY